MLSEVKGKGDGDGEKCGVKGNSEGCGVEGNAHGNEGVTEGRGSTKGQYEGRMIKGMERGKDMAGSVGFHSEGSQRYIYIPLW